MSRLDSPFQTSGTALRVVRGSWFDRIRTYKEQVEDYFGKRKFTKKIDGRNVELNYQYSMGEGNKREVVYDTHAKRVSEVRKREAAIDKDYHFFARVQKELGINAKTHQMNFDELKRYESRLLRIQKHQKTEAYVTKLLCTGVFETRKTHDGRMAYFHRSVEDIEEGTHSEKKICAQNAFVPSAHLRDFGLHESTSNLSMQYARAIQEYCELLEHSLDQVEGLNIALHNSVRRWHAGELTPYQQQCNAVTLAHANYFELRENIRLLRIHEEEVQPPPDLVTGDTIRAYQSRPELTLERMVA